MKVAFVVVCLFPSSFIIKHENIIANVQPELFGTKICVRQMQKKWTPKNGQNDVFVLCNSCFAPKLKHPEIICFPLSTIAIEL